MKITGHLTESVYRRYAIVSEADISDGLGKLAALTAQGRTGGSRVERQDSQDSYPAVISEFAP